MAGRAGRSSRTSALWARLTFACTLVTLGVLGATFVLSYINLRVQLLEYVKHRYGSMPDSISRQLAAYYERQDGWDGVEILIQDDFPLGQADVMLVDAAGAVVYDSRGPAGGVVNLQDQRAMWPIRVHEHIVGRWSLQVSAEPAPESPEYLLLGSLKGLLLFAAVLATGVGLVVSGVLTRSLTRPLQRLVGAVQAVAAGDLSQHVEEKGSDEVVQVARAFNEMTAALERAEELRENVMADIAHELRTPLSVIQGNLRAILDEVYPLEKAEIARLYDETRLLSRLVDDLRELAQAEAGQLGLNLRTTDVAALCRSTVTNFEPAVESKGIALSLHVSALLPAIQADPDRLAQVLRNLLTNALRHTPPGGQIVVRAGLREDAVHVAVTDSGHGIAPEHLGRVFDRFWRADRSRSRENGGSGLGLAIAQSLVQAHGGRIWVESALGQGTTFTFALPVKLDRPQTERR